MKQLIRVLKALGDPNRMRIVKMLMHREMCVCELAEAISVTQPSVSRHMKLLEDADLVEHRRDGLWINYDLNRAPQNPYAQALLGHLQNWLEEDPDIQALIRKASTLDREIVCRRNARGHRTRLSRTGPVNETKQDPPPFRVLFLCTGNSCRSQMAEGWARHLLGEQIEAFSAGTDPTVVNPRATEVMKEVGVDLSSHRSKSVTEFSDQRFELVVTLCEDAEARCPVFLGGTRKIHMGFPDPAQATGPHETVLMVYRDVRDRIRRELIPLLEKEVKNHRTGSV